MKKQRKSIAWWRPLLLILPIAGGGLLVWHQWGQWLADLCSAIGKVVLLP